MLDFLSKNSLALTIAFIVLAAIVAALVRRLKRDRCLKSFAGDTVMLEDTEGKAVCGVLHVENTGLEVAYHDKAANPSGLLETSYILYKHEYPKIVAVIRYHDRLDGPRRKQRQKELERTYHPSLARKLKRRTLSVFKTLRDSVLEVAAAVFSQARKAAPVAGMFKSQEKYVSQMREDLLASTGTAYEPLLEKRIGSKVIVELVKGDKLVEYGGILKDYTADFVQIMDAAYTRGQEDKPSTADVVFSRKYGVIRHLGQ